MSENMYDVLSKLSSVWGRLTDEEHECIAQMIVGARGRSLLKCNCCGRPLSEWDMQENFHIHTSVGYGSKYDGEEIDLRMCCECFDYLVDSCAVSPVKE